MNREIKFRAWDSVHNRMIYSDKHLGFRPLEDNNSFDNYDFIVWLMMNMMMTLAVVYVTKQICLL